jgi:hypothetical protein
MAGLILYAGSAGDILVNSFDGSAIPQTHFDY